MSACERATSVPEIAEHIFLELCYRDLLCNIQGTCKTWKAIVDSSTPLQEALFRRPVRSQPLRFFPDAHCYYDPNSGNWLIDKADRETHKIVEHPLVTMLYKGGTTRKKDLKLSAMNRPEASWRKCLATQPPVAGVKLPPIQVEARQRTGVTLEQLLSFGDVNKIDFREIRGYNCWKLCDPTKMRAREVLRLVKYGTVRPISPTQKAD